MNLIEIIIYVKKWLLNAGIHVNFQYLSEIIITPDTALCLP